MLRAPIVSRLAIGWMAQLRRLQKSLLREPAHAMAWRWKIRAKILTYLILRYGADPDLDLRLSPGTPPTPASVPDVSGQSLPCIRSRGELADILKQIALINTFKPDLAPSHRPRIVKT